MRRLLVALAALAAAPAPAQQVVVPAEPGRAAVQADKDGLVLPAGEFAVVELIESVARFLCRNYLYDPGPVLAAQGFTLQRRIALDALGAEELLYALLSTREFAVLPLDESRGVYQVVSLRPDPRRSDVVVATPWRPADEILRRPRLREIVVTAVELDAADAQTIAAVLRNAFAVNGQWRPGSLLANAGDRRFLVLHGYRDVVAPAILFARQLDRVSAPRPADPALERLARLEAEVQALKAQLAARR